MAGETTITIPFSNRSRKYRAVRSPTQFACRAGWIYSSGTEELAFGSVERVMWIMSIHSFWNCTNLVRYAS